MNMSSIRWRPRSRRVIQAPDPLARIRAAAGLALLIVALSAVAVLVTSSPDHVARVTPSTAEDGAVDLGAVDRFVSDQIKAASVAGAAVAITHGDQIVHVAGFGHDSTGVVVTGGTLFRVASLSKSMTATAVMQLVDEDRLELDDPVVDHLPEFRVDDPRGADITVRQLLEQTSGLADSQVHDASRKQPESIAESVTALRAARLVAAPGSEWHYTNPNYEVAARLVEVVTGEPFGTYLRDHVFDPAGMTSASSVDHDDEKVEGLGDGHATAYGHAIAVHGPHAFEGGAGGVVASAADMAHWLVVQTNHGRATDGTIVLSEQSLVEQHTPGTDTHGYALGWDTVGPADGPTRLEHTGSLITWNAYMAVMPASGYGVAVLLNTGSGLMLDQTAIFHGVQDIVEGTNLTPSGPAGSRFDATTVDRLLGLVTLAALLLAVRGVLGARGWARRLRQQSWLVAGARTAPYLALLMVVAGFPQLVGRLLARDVTWEDTAYGWPALTVLLAAVFLSTSTTLVSRAWQATRPTTMRCPDRSGLGPESAFTPESVTMRLAGAVSSEQADGVHPA